MSEVPMYMLIAANPACSPLKGIPCSSENARPLDPTGGLRVGPSGGPRRGAVSNERGFHVLRLLLHSEGVPPPPLDFEGVPPST